MYSLRRCCALPMAASTDCLLTRDLMFEAVPISSASILEVRLIWPLGGMTSEIMEVPLPRASWRPLTSCWEDEREKKGGWRSASVPGARSFSGFWLSGYAREWGEARVEGVLTLRTFHTAVKNNTRTGKRWSVRLGIVKATGAIRPRRREGAQEGARWPPSLQQSARLEGKKNDWGRGRVFSTHSRSPRRCHHQPW